MNNELTQALQDAARLAAEASEAVAHGDPEAATKLKQAELAWRKAERLGKQRTKRPAQSKLPSMRERAIATVTELNVPCSPKLIARYSEARRGEPFDLRAIASIRRDEQRSWGSTSRRDIYLVPALEGPWLVAARGRFVLSHWPLWQRIISPLTPRVSHLQVCLHLIDQVGSVSTQADVVGRMQKLLIEYARTVPGTLEYSWDNVAELDITRIREAVDAELRLIREEDEIWRIREAERAARTLDQTQLVWGGSAPEIVGGTEK